MTPVLIHSPSLLLRSIRGWIGVVGLMGLSCNVALAQPPGDQPPATQPPANQPSTDPAQTLAEWVAQLDSSRFRDREEATRALSELGSPAIVPLEQVARTGNQELRARAIYVLRQIAIEEDPIAESPARDSLKRLAESGSTFVRHRVVAAIDEVDRVRQSRTLAYLQERGAVLKTELVILEQQISYTGGIALVLDETWKGSIEDLSRFEFLRDLSAIQITGSWITDEVIEAISRAKQIRLVSIRAASITDRSVVALASMGKLEGLEFRYCPIADDSIPTLKRFQFLSRLKLIGTKVSAEAAADLIELFGISIVDYRQGGFLGVSCQTLGQQCQVSQVVVGTAAAKCGIKVGDVIVRVDDTAILSSDHLIETLSKYAVGDKVMIAWSRNNETFEKELELGEFADLN